MGTADVCTWYLHYDIINYCGVLKGGFASAKVILDTRSNGDICYLWTYLPNYTIVSIVIIIILIIFNGHDTRSKRRLTSLIAKCTYVEPLTGRIRVQ